MAESRGDYSETLFGDLSARLEDLRRIGENDKCIASLEYGPGDLSSRELMELVQDLCEGGCGTIITSHLKFDGYGRLFVYSEYYLQCLLDENRGVCEEAGWPTDAVDFVSRVATEKAPGKTAIFDLIADAFGDRFNPGRTDAGPANRLRFLRW